MRCSSVNESKELTQTCNLERYMCNHIPFDTLIWNSYMWLGEMLDIPVIYSLIYLIGAISVLLRSRVFPKYLQLAIHFPALYVTGRVQCMYLLKE